MSGAFIMNTHRDCRMHRSVRQSPPGNGSIAMWEPWGDEPPGSRLPDRGDGGDDRSGGGWRLVPS